MASSKLFLGEECCGKSSDKDKKFENTFRWRQDSNELMATAMLSQVLYPIPSLLKGFVARVFVSIVDWDSE